MKLALLAAVFAAGFSATDAVVKDRDSIDWKVSPSLPAAASTHEYHMIREDKTSGAVQTLVRFPKGFVLGSHSHTHDETVIVLKGKLSIEMGGKERVLGPGSYAVIPGGTSHSMGTKGWGAAEMVISWAGPVDFKGLPTKN